MARKSRKAQHICETRNTSAKVAKKYIAAIYIRISNETDISEDNNKLENQERIIRDFVKQKPELNIYKVYQDNGFTGTNFSRKAFVRMIEDIKEGKINCILVKDLSRLGRNIVEVEQYIQVIFPFLDVRFIAVNDNFDTLYQQTDTTISLKNIINASYSKDLSKKILSAKQIAMEKGKFMGSIPSYGYERAKDAPHKLVVNETTGKVVKEIFALKLAGKTNTEIIKWLEENKIDAPMKYWYRRGVVHNEKYANVRWNLTSLKIILENQVYLGHMVQGKRRSGFCQGIAKRIKRNTDTYIIVRKTHEPIIDEKLFGEVQRICAREAERNCKIRAKYKEIEKSEHILENIIFCADGRKMLRTRQINEKQEIAYRYIASRSGVPVGERYKSYYISEDVVFHILKETLYKHIQMFFSIKERMSDKKIQDSLLTSRREKGREIAGLQKEVNQYIEYIASLYEDLAEGIITRDEYEELRKDYSGKRDKAKTKLEDLLDIDNQLESLSLFISKNKARYRKFLKDQELSKELIHILIKKITITGKEEIHITFCFEDDIILIHEKFGGKK